MLLMLLGIMLLARLRLVWWARLHSSLALLRCLPFLFALAVYILCGRLYSVLVAGVSPVATKNSRIKPFPEGLNS